MERWNCITTAATTAADSTTTTTTIATAGFVVYMEGEIKKTQKM